MFDLAQWHYPRPDFAEQLHGLLTRGPSHALSMFGPRRTGKTQFLLNDLGPLAEARRHRVVYVSFWQLSTSPLALLLYRLDRALNHGGVFERIGRATEGLKAKFSISALGGKIEVDLGKAQTSPPEDLFLVLDRLLDRFSDPKRPSILMFDEFQELAKSKQGDTVIAALRTALDTRKDSLVSVFTGSSQLGLKQVFSRRKAPFYRFATPVQLPTLTEAFVDHQLAAFHRAFRGRVNRDNALKVFHANGQDPMVLQRWLMARGTYAGIDDDEILARVKSEIAGEYGFEETWLDQLTAMHRAVLWMLANRIESPQGQAGEAYIGALLPDEEIKTSKIQSALNTLERRGLADQFDKQWRISDPLFETWVLSRQEDIRPDGTMP